jgi:hypothetical protein
MNNAFTYQTPGMLLIQAAARNLLERLKRREASEPALFGHRVAKALGFADGLDQWQQDLLRSPALQIIMLASRQSGKSTVAAILGLHRAIYWPNSLVLLLSPSLRQSQELFRRVKEAYSELPESTRPVEESALRLMLSNKSRIIALPGDEKTVRGFSSVDLLIVDETARVEDELYMAVRPMMAVSGGRIVLLSTPFGKRGFFYQEWTEGGDAWQRVKITAAQCPRISRAWLEQERQRIGDWWFAQEYDCEFLDATSQFFRTEDIEAALDHSIKPLV